MCLSTNNLSVRNFASSITMRLAYWHKPSKHSSSTILGPAGNKYVHKQEYYNCMHRIFCMTIRTYLWCEAFFATYDDQEHDECEQTLQPNQEVIHKHTYMFKNIIQLLTWIPRATLDEHEFIQYLCVLHRSDMVEKNINLSRITHRSDMCWNINLFRST